MKLTAQVSGNGPPLIFLHGLFGSARNWSGVARQLQGTRRIHLLDARNHGASPRHPSMTYTQMADDLHEYIAANRLQGSVVLGHSMGGKTAMTLALEQPELISALIIADIAPVAYQPHHAALIRAMRETDLSGLTRRAGAEQRLGEKIDDAPTCTFLTSNLVTTEDGLTWPFNLDAIDAGHRDLSEFPDAHRRRYPGPVLFLIGGKSEYVRREHHETIDRLFPASRIITIDGAGHWLHAEKRDIFIENVRGFLKNSR
ncbi:MAG: alpha/beta fold hydrolase [Rhodospirillales bacterium]